MTEKHELIVRTLGDFTITWQGRQISGGSRDSQFARLMGILLHYSETGVERGRLEDMLFEDSNSEDPHHMLRYVKTCTGILSAARANCAPPAKKITPNTNVRVVIKINCFSDFAFIIIWNLLTLYQLNGILVMPGRASNSGWPDPSSFY